MQNLVLCSPIIAVRVSLIKRKHRMFCVSVLFKSIERNVILSKSFLPFPFPCFRENIKGLAAETM